MLSNAYFLAKFRFDTAENEPAKNLQNFAKFANFADPNPLTLTPPPEVRHAGRRGILIEAKRRLNAETEVLPIIDSISFFISPIMNEF